MILRKEITTADGSTIPIHSYCCNAGVVFQVDNYTNEVEFHCDRCESWNFYITYDARAKTITHWEIPIEINGKIVLFYASPKGLEIKGFDKYGKPKILLQAKMNIPYKDKEKYATKLMKMKAFL
jgi:hypothetical protein